MENLFITSMRGLVEVLTLRRLRRFQPMHQKLFLVRSAVRPSVQGRFVFWIRRARSIALFRLRTRIEGCDAVIRVYLIS